MPRYILVLLGMSLLVGCLPEQPYTKNGMAPMSWKYDLDQCSRHKDVDVCMIEKGYDDHRFTTPGKLGTAYDHQ